MTEAEKGVTDMAHNSYERRYRKPPVIEALCELYFEGSAWDDTVPGVFYERVRNNYLQKRQRQVREAHITLGPEQAAAGVRQLPSWMQFVSEEKHRMIQLAQDLLVVNQLAPYPHFEEWEPEIYEALGYYKELARPQRIARVGVRYLNMVVIREAQVLLEDYFTVYPNLPRSLGDAHGPFMVRVEVQQGSHTVLITFGTAPAPEPSDGVQAFALDVYDIVQLDSAVNDDLVKEHVRQAHQNIVRAFEDSITDKLRDLLEREG